MAIGNNCKWINKKNIINCYNRYIFPEFYDGDNINEIYNIEHHFTYKEPDNNFKIEKIRDLKKLTQPLVGPMDSPWSMYGHDIHHTSRSPYNTIDTWSEIWNFETYGWAEGGPVIDNDGIIYIGAYSLYAIYSNGNLKWKFDTIFTIDSAPAIDENGIIYFGTIYGSPDYLYAVNSDGELKWKYQTGSIFSSPVIGEDGTIFFGEDSHNIWALHPNGTVKWRFGTGHVIYSSPAIGLDGTVYCGCHDGNIYAINPNNGTLKWKYNTGNWVHGSPTIGDDGTVYIGSDNGYLYAFNPSDGAVKWMVYIGAVYGSPALDKNGILYVGSWDEKFYAIYPNGTIKWSYYTDAHVWGSSAALSDEGTLYFGTCDLEWSGGIEIIALYFDGTVKWRRSLDTIFSSPAIGSDGAVYIGSCGEPGKGFLHAFGIGELEAVSNGPYYGLISKPVQLKGSYRGGVSPISYHWDFGNGNSSDEQNPTNIYTNTGSYEVVLTVTDDEDNTDNDTTYAWIQETNEPPDKPTIDGPTFGSYYKPYDYNLSATDPDGSDIYLYIDWGDKTSTGPIGPYSSGEQVIRSHTWENSGTFTIRCKAIDPYDEEGPWETLDVTMPRSRMLYNTLFMKFLERFPNAFHMLRLLLDL
jgi:outer membrane protein assembly factor BamB